MSPDPLTDSAIRERIASVPHWYHRIEIRPGIVTPGTNDSTASLARLTLPADCTGLSVLDIGTRDGFFAFELERRGARVLAVDYAPPGRTGFQVAAELLESSVPYVQADLYDLSPDRHGRFDLVLFLGVLYHLHDPIGALRIVRSLCSGRMYVETHVIDEEGLLLPDGRIASLRAAAPQLMQVPIMQFFPGDALGGDFTNWWAPNVSCLTAMLGETGFFVEQSRVYGSRAVLECRVAPPSLKSCHDRLVRSLPESEEDTTRKRPL